MRRLTERNLEVISDRAAALWERLAWALIVGGYRDCEDATAYLGEHYGLLARWTAKGMVAAHVYARLQAAQRALPHIRKQYRFSADNPWDTATEFMRRRASLTDEQIASLETMYSQDATRVAVRTQAHLNAALRATVAQTVAEGVHVRGGIEMLTERRAMSKHLAETLFRTQNRIASVAGQMSANADPDIDEILWGYEYITERDDRVREEHAALHGTKYRKGDSALKWVTPPLGYNCRCKLIEIYEDEKSKQHEVPPPSTTLKDGVQVPVQADNGFNFNPGDLYRDTLAVERGVLKVPPVIRPPVVLPKPKPKVPVPSAVAPPKVVAPKVKRKVIRKRKVVAPKRKVVKPKPTTQDLRDDLREARRKRQLAEARVAEQKREIAAMRRRLQEAEKRSAQVAELKARIAAKEREIAAIDKRIKRQERHRELLR